MTTLHAVVAVQATQMDENAVALEVALPFSTLPKCVLADALEAAVAELRANDDCGHHDDDLPAETGPEPAVSGWRRWLRLGGAAR